MRLAQHNARIAATDDASVGARLAIGGALWLMVAAIWFLRRRLS
jgi:hypothetical protein